MISGRDGSSASQEARRPGTGSASGVPLPVLPPGSGVYRQASVSSDTVIHKAGLGPVAPAPIAGESPSSQVIVRLFPPTHDSGTVLPEFNPSGLELGHFKIEERIGMGGMGAVFRAVDLSLQRYVALKLLAPSQCYDPASVKRFENEARAAARLDHENIARVYFIGEDRGLHFIAFEYVTGSNVRDIIRRSGRLSPTDAVNYALQIAYALKHTSAMGVVHRDVKPSNIVITPNGRAKLVDLGLARKESAESHDLTVSGTTLGTFDYISPEQAKDPRSVDVRSDIYSLGCTIYHMLTGQPPYPEGTALQKLLDHQNKDTPNPQLLNPAISDELATVVLKMMSSDRNKRHQTPDQLIRDLSLVAAQLGLRGLHPEGLVWLTSRALQPRNWTSQLGWIATVVVLLGVVGLLQRFPQISRRLAGNSSATAIVDKREEADLAGQQPVTRPPAFIEPTSADSKREIASIDTSKTPGSQGATKPESELPPSFVATTGESSADISKPAASIGSEKKPPEKKPGDATASTAPVVGPESPSKPNPSPMKTASSTEPSQEGGVTVFTSSGGLLREYRTLEAACSAVEDGGVVELRFNGRRSEKPCRIARKNVTIRGARGFAPVVQFAPARVVSAPGESRMLNVQAGPLNVVNVALEMLVPSDGVAAEYALFGLIQPSHLQLSGVLVTVRNPRSLNATVISLGPDRGRSPNDMPRMPLMPFDTDVKAVVEINDCLVRGNVSLTSIDCQGPTQFTLRNTALALGRDAITINSLSPVMPDKASISLRFDHVTSLHSGHFLRFVGVGQGEQHVTVQAVARNSIFTTTSDLPLVQMDVSVTSEDARRVLSWSGERNFYNAAESLWAITSTGEIVDFEEWIEHWGPSNEVGPNNNPIQWVSERPEAFDAATIEHFVLRDERGVENPPVRGATDGDHAGVAVTKLPTSSVDSDEDE